MGLWTVEPEGSLFASLFHPPSATKRRHPPSIHLVFAAVGLGRWVLGFFGPEYAEAGCEAFVILALTSPLLLTNYVLATELRVAKRIRPLFAIAIVASETVLLLAYFFLPAWGIAGAAAAFGLGQGIVVPLFAYERRRNGSTGSELLAK